MIQVFEFHSAGNDYEMITCHYWDSMLHRKMGYRENADTSLIESATLTKMIAGLFMTRQLPFPTKTVNYE